MFPPMTAGLSACVSYKQSRWIIYFTFQLYSVKPANNHAGNRFTYGSVRWCANSLLAKRESINTFTQHIAGTTGPFKLRKQVESINFFFFLDWHNPFLYSFDLHISISMWFAAVCYDPNNGNKCDKEFAWNFVPPMKSWLCNS